MKRCNWINLFCCPICGKNPYVKLYPLHSGMAYCKGYGIHRHREIRVEIEYTQPSELCKKLSEKWNAMHFEQARFLFDVNGNPFKEVKE